MTPKRTGTDEPRATEHPKLNKETLKDLEPKRRGEEVKGGAGYNTQYCQYGDNGESRI